MPYEDSVAPGQATLFCKIGFIGVSGDSVALRSDCEKKSSVKKMII